jgi:hypothetical protein
MSTENIFGTDLVLVQPLPLGARTHALDQNRPQIANLMQDNQHALKTVGGPCVCSVCGMVCLFCVCVWYGCTIATIATIATGGLRSLRCG